MKRLFAPLLAALLWAAPVSAGPFDDMSEADRAALGAEVRRYLLENPQILMEIVSELEAQQAAVAQLAEAEALERFHDEIFNDGVSFVGGNPDGDITIVEFLDYQCSFCKRAHPDVSALLSRDGNIRLIQKEFPILGPTSEEASRAAIAVLMEQGPQIYEVFADRLMSHDGPLNSGIIIALARASGADVDKMQAKAGSPEVSEVIAANRALGQVLDITGTPTFIIENEFVRGYLPLEGMAEKVAEKRAEM